jgi:pectate lyase
MKLLSCFCASIASPPVWGLCLLVACGAEPAADPGDGPGAGSAGVAVPGAGAGGASGAPSAAPGSGVVASPGGSGGSIAGSGGGGQGAAGQPPTAGASSGAAGSDAAGSDGGSGQGGGAGSDAAGSGADPSCEGGSQVDFALVGWATEGGGTTGGQGGTTIDVSDGAALMQALEDKQDSDTPLTILVSGVITEANSGVEKIDVKDVSDVSIIGVGDGAEFDGIGIKIVRVSNIIVRNLHIHDVLSGDKDAISIEGPADHIWIDHCELDAEHQGVDKDHYDGLLDAKAQAEYITYSWNYLHDSWKAALVGSSEDDTFDRKLTMHHNFFQNCNSRMPLFRGGNGHVFNNYYLDGVETAINSRIEACVRIEANYFENTHNPWVSAYSDVLGGGELLCNVRQGSDFAYADDTFELPACEATVPYDYADVLNHPDQVPTVVMQNAGVGKLEDPTDF